jgi:drug/metabolite transporter (DMT)-like permease
MMQSYAALVFSILAGIVGQLVLKAGAARSSGSIIAQLLTPLSICGLGLYFFAALAYMYALRKIPVSVAFPAVALSYPIVALLAYWTAGEQLGLNRMIGIGLVVAGVALINRPG